MGNFKEVTKINLKRNGLKIIRTVQKEDLFEDYLVLCGFEERIDPPVYFIPNFPVPTDTDIPASEPFSAVAT